MNSRNIAACAAMIGFVSTGIAADPKTEYLTSESSPKVFVRHDLADGVGGHTRVAVPRSFVDPRADTDANPTRYTDLVKPGDPFAIDNLKIFANGQWQRIMSDSDNRAGGPADGFEDGFGNAVSLYDLAMTVIALTHAGDFGAARELLNGFKPGTHVVFDDDTTASLHPGGSVKDQAEQLTFMPASIIAPSFDIWLEKSNDTSFDAGKDQRMSGYPRLAPGHEFGIWFNQPVRPTWAGVDDLLDVPRVSEFRDDFDTDGEFAALLPYHEEQWYHRMFVPYSLFFQWYNVDTPVAAGTEDSQRIDLDRILSFSALAPRQASLRDFSISVGDNLWLVIAILNFTAATNDTQFLPVVFTIMDTIVDNLQDFNGGIHFGYYGSHEITPTSTEHNLDFAFAWNWIDRLHTEGKIDDEHWQRYKTAMEGNIHPAPGAIRVLNITDYAGDDQAVSGADLMLKFLGISHALLDSTRSGRDLVIPSECKVLILPESPLADSGNLKDRISDFCNDGGSVFGTCATAVGLGETDNPFGVSFETISPVSDESGQFRSILITKVYKDGVDSPSFAIDSNLNGLLDVSDVSEPQEMDNWEEGLGNLTFGFRAGDPNGHLLLWSLPDYKRSRLTYFLSDIGDNFHALNGGVTPDLDAAHSAEELAQLRRSNEGNNITCERIAAGPTVFTANDNGNLSMCIAKLPATSAEMLYFNEPGSGDTRGKAVFFAGDMFTFFHKAMHRLTVGTEQASPYKGAFVQAFQSHAQILENSLQWFFTEDLDPVYTVRHPYGSTAVYDNHAKEDMGFFGVHNLMGKGQPEGKSLSVDLSFAEGDSGNRVIRIDKDATEESAGLFLTKSKDFGEHSSMEAGRVDEAFIGAQLDGATRLSFRCKATIPTKVEFGFGIDKDGQPDVIDPEHEDSAHASVTVDVNTGWETHSIDTTGMDLSHINGLFFAKILHAGATTLFIDDVHFAPRVFGYNQEFKNGDSVIYREGYGNEGIWSGFMGARAGNSLSIDRRWEQNPRSGRFCVKVEKKSDPFFGPEPWAGIFVQQRGGDTDPIARWNTGPGIGADLTGSIHLRFSVRADRDATVSFGFGINPEGAMPGDSARWTQDCAVGTDWRECDIPLSGMDLSHINGLFFFSTGLGEITLFLDDIRYTSLDGTLPRTYQEDVDLGNQSPFLWRNKHVAHLGVRHFLENAVWADSDDFVRLPPGCFQSSADPDGDGIPLDFQYEDPDAMATWPAPKDWTRRKFFLRGQLDFVKAADLTTWGAAYWLDRTQPNLPNARALLSTAEEVFMTTVSDKGVTVSSMEYWDLPNNDLVGVGDDFGESVWPEGIGQLIQAAYLAGDVEQAERHLREMRKIEFTFADGKKAYPYSWPRNMITDIGGPGEGDDQERLKALSLAATTWMFIGENKASTYAFATLPPLPHAGEDQTIHFPGKASLQGSVENAAAASVLWKQEGGPGNVTFVSTNQLPTEASFSAPGKYILSLTATATASGRTGTDMIRISVKPPDTDQDALDDAWEQQIIDARTNDGILTLTDVRPGDDFDADGATNRDEFIAGTNPASGASRFAITEAFFDSQHRLVIRWNSSGGHRYNILKADGALSGFSPVHQNIKATPPLNSFVAGPRTGSPGFYRIEVVQED